MAAHAPKPNQAAWPELPLNAWHDTYATLHMWTQVVGKVRLALSPRVNHWWEVPLYVNARGLTTSAIPWGNGIFEVQFDFVDHKLTIQTSWDSSQSIALRRADGRCLLLRIHGRAEIFRHRRKNLDYAGRNPESRALRERHSACFLRRRICAPLLARS